MTLKRISGIVVCLGALYFCGVEPFTISTERFLLDQPDESDVDDITAYCADPVFEKFMVTPWPYKREHALYFVDEYVPTGWAEGTEWTWAVREGAGASLLGVVGVRLHTGMVGYWLGAPHRGRGVVPEALGAAIREVFERTDRSEILWECAVGNHASLRVAQKIGFDLTGRRLGLVFGRDGAPVDSWTGRLRSSVVTADGQVD